MIKLLAIDLDGTLLNENLEISSENVEAITLARKAGIKVIIATGRPEQLVKPYIEQLNMEDDLIMYNGSVIGHPFKEEKLYSKELSKESAREVIEFCEKHDYICMVYTKAAIISKPNYRVTFFEEKNKLLSDKNKCVFKDIRDIDEILSEEINKILLIEKDVNKYNIAKDFAKELKDCSVVQSQNGFIDINPMGASKGAALAFYSKKLGFKRHEIAAVGDQDNDVSMLEFAELSIAMGNASEGAVNAAKYHTLTNNENGVAIAIMKYLLKS
jgi:Cof subfamily protein (haloacid dehalogenase superfamily)